MKFSVRDEWDVGGGEGERKEEIRAEQLSTFGTARLPAMRLATRETSVYLLCFFPRGQTMGRGSGTRERERKNKT